jgi:hypothetical protein
MAELKQTIHEALDNAVENGHLDLVMGKFLSEIARDLESCSGIGEGVPREEVIGHIKSWQEKHMPEQTEAPKRRKAAK